MLVDFIVVSFAAFMSWTLIRTITPVAIPPRLAGFVVLIVSFLWACAFPYPFLLAMAATGGCALLIKIVGADVIEPLNIPKISIKKKPKLPSSPRRRGDVGSRVPTLP